MKRIIPLYWLNQIQKNVRDSNTIKHWKYVKRVFIYFNPLKKCGNPSDGGEVLRFMMRDAIFSLARWKCAVAFPNFSTKNIIFRSFLQHLGRMHGQNKISDRRPWTGGNELYFRATYKCTIYWCLITIQKKERKYLVVKYRQQWWRQRTQNIELYAWCNRRRILSEIQLFFTVLLVWARCSIRGEVSQLPNNDDQHCSQMDNMRLTLEPSNLASRRKKPRVFIVGTVI